MRWAVLLVIVMMSGCLTTDTEVIPDEWPADPALRPGAQLFFDNGGTYSQCTAGFMFASPDNETLYLSFSAHCIRAGDHQLGDPVYARPPGEGRSIGTLAFDAGWQDAGDIERDFALVALSNRAGVREKASPAVMEWGGPRGIAASQTALPGTQVVTYGNSINRDSDHAAEGRLVLTLDGSTRVRLDRPAINGDSGGPLLTAAGDALGILHGGQTYEVVVLTQEVNVFTPLDEAITILRAEGKGSVRDAQLVTWDAWNGPGGP